VFCKAPEEPFACGSIVRAPKQGNLKGWELLEKITRIPAFKNAPPTSLAHYYKTKGNLDAKQHAPPNIRKVLWVPQKLSEYKDWVQYMLTTKTPIEKYSNHNPP
jgi:hypothetical protein